jgi:hypothetical protein
MKILYHPYVVSIRALVRVFDTRCGRHTQALVWIYLCCFISVHLRNVLLYDWCHVASFVFRSDLGA